jgi:hypothetical protein
MYVIVLTFTVGVTALNWFPQALFDVLLSIPKSLETESDTIRLYIQKWLRTIRLSNLLVFGIVLAAMGVAESLLRERYAWSTVGLPPPWGWVTVHFQILVAISGILFGGGVLIWLSTLQLLGKLLAFKLRLFQYRGLHSLSTLTAGMTIVCIIAIALFILLIFGELDVATITVGVAATGFAVITFVFPQMFYYGAVMRAKREMLDKFGDMYEHYYKIVDRKNIETESLQIAKTGIESISTLEKSIKDIPVWLIAVSDAIRILLSLLTPAFSILINYVLSKLP